MKIKYREHKFKRDGIEKIEKINAIVEEYSQQGYQLTLRQTYYQLVARDFIENTEKSYKNIGNLIDNARLAGLIDWDTITDRTRILRGWFLCSYFKKNCNKKGPVLKLRCKHFQQGLSISIRRYFISPK